MSRLINTRTSSICTSQNLLMSSEDQSTTSWSMTNVTVASGQSDPFGGTSACKIVVNTATTATHRLNYNLNNVKTGTALIYAAYLKANGYNWVGVATQNSFSYINLSNGTLGTQSPNITPTVTSIGNSWYFVYAIVPYAMSGGTNIPAIRWAPAPADNTISYTGDGVSGTFIYATQANYGKILSPYIKTTTTPFNDTLSFRPPVNGRVINNSRIFIP